MRLALVLCAAFLGACRSDSLNGLFNCEEMKRFSEMIVVDARVLSDGRAQNASAGAWSFRHAMESISPANTGEFTDAWLQAWGREASVDVEAAVLCPWRKRNAANACDETCNACASRTLDLSSAPFRLIAIVNRTDLGAHADAVSPAGEGRLVYALTDGVADDARSAPLPFTVILEYAQRDGTDARGWARAWHALGEHALGSESHREALASLTERFVSSGAASLAQLRIHDERFSAQPFFELALDDHGALVPRALGVMTDPGVRPERATCAGCHASDNGVIDGAFHISPLREASAALSPFLFDPSAWQTGELALREARATSWLCSDPMTEMP